MVAVGGLAQPMGFVEELQGTEEDAGQKDEDEGDEGGRHGVGE